MKTSRIFGALTGLLGGLFTGLLTGLTGLSANAQDIIITDETEGPGTQSVTIEEAPYQNPPLPKVIWGIKGNIGAELPSASWTHNGDKTRMFNSGFGASIGGLANIYLGKYFYFEPEVALFYEGYSYNNMMQVAPNSPSVNGGPNVYKLGVRVPLVFGYYINISDMWGLNIFTGPELNYAFYGTTKTDNEEVKQNHDLMQLYGDGLYAQRRFDLDWKVGIGFPVNSFMITLEGDIGITNMLKKGTLRENRVGLGIAYYFVD